jgi:hypothetical protein
MADNASLSFIADHWVLLVLVLCPVVIVLMALAALTCEVCGAPFGIFRRRSKTIDLCIRCALLHDMRRAKELREASDVALQNPGVSEDPASKPPAIHDERQLTTHTSSSWT